MVLSLFGSDSCGCYNAVGKSVIRHQSSQINFQFWSEHAKIALSHRALGVFWNISLTWLVTLSQALPMGLEHLYFQLYNMPVHSCRWTTHFANQKWFSGAWPLERPRFFNAVIILYTMFGSIEALHSGWKEVHSLLSTALPRFHVEDAGRQWSYNVYVFALFLHTDV